MKKTTIPLFIVIFLFLMPFSLNSFAADTTRMSLPEGAIARLGKGIINEIAYSPNGEYLAVAASVGIWIYDMETYQEVALLTGPTGPVSSVAFSPDGSTIVSGYDSGDILVWDVKTGKRMQSFPTVQEWVSSVAFSPDGKIIASGGACVEGMCPGITLLDNQTGEWLKSFGGPYTTLSLCFSPDGKTLASSGDERNSNIRLWDVQTGELLITLKKRTAFEDFEGRDVNSVVFSPNRNMIASGSGNGTIRLWNAHTGEFIKYLEGHTKPVNSVAFSPNGKTLISAGEDGVCLWDVNTGEYIKNFPIHAVSAAFSPDGRTCAIVSEMGIFIRNAHTLQHLESLAKNRGSEDNNFRGKDIGSIGSVAFSPDGNTIASCGGNNIHLWDSHTNQLLKTFIGHTESVNSVVFSPDGETIASASDDRTIRLWNVKTRKPVKTLMAHASSVNSVVFSSDGETIASSGNDRIIRLWNASTGELLKTLTGHIENVNTVAFSPDGNTIASGSGRLVYLGGGEDVGTCVGQEIRLWNANTGKLIKTLKGHTSVVNSVVFSPNGNTIASGSGHWRGYEGVASAGEEICLWNANTGELIKTLTGHKDVVSSVIFSPDGNLIVSGDWYWNGRLSSGTWSGEIRVWDAETGELIKTLTGHTGGVSSVTFSPDGKTLASGRTDGTILIWDFSNIP